MASLGSPSYPGSPQLRSICRYRESSSFFLQIRFRLSQRRTVLYAYGGSRNDGREGQSWSISNSLRDPFAGWSGLEGDGEGDSQGKGGRGGLLGAGLAGLLLFGGLTFATLSLRSKNSRNISGIEQQMKPLTTEQEVLLTSDDTNAEIIQDGNETNPKPYDTVNKINDDNPDSVTGINKDPFPPLEVFDVTEDKRDIISAEIIDSIDDGSGSVDSFHYVSTEDDCQIENDVNEVSIPPDSNSFPLQNNEKAQIFGNIDTLSINTFTVDYEENVVSNDQTNILNEYEESSSEPLSLSKGVGTERVEYSSINTISSGISSGSDFDQNEALTLPAESLNIEEAFKLEETSSVAFSVPVYANDTGNEPNSSIYYQSNRDSTFESLFAQKAFPFTGVPAPSLVSSVLQVPLGKVLVPAIVDQVQSQAFQALQVLKVIEANAQPGDICTRREYARWLVSASSVLTRNTTSKLYPAMYIENVSELAFDDITHEDPDFSSIQGLAEAGIIFSKLSLSDTSSSSIQNQNQLLFYPESPLSRQDLVSWKMALEKKQLPEVDKNLLYQASSFIDIEKIDSGAWPALLADLSSGEQGIISLAFGYTRLFQPNKPVTKAQAVIALATGEASEIVGEELARIEAESLAESAVNAHSALVAQVEKDLNASFEQELANEREKINALERLAEEARLKLEKMRTEREEENEAILRGQAAVRSEMEVLSRLRCEVEEQLQQLMTNKVEISFERERINKLRKETESENQLIVQLQHDLEVERKALSMARTWAEEEAKRARELARALEEARERWMKHGIKVVVDEDLQADATTGITWVTAGKQTPTDETISKAELLVDKLKAMAAEMKLKSSIVIKNIIQTIAALISALKRQASEGCKQVVLKSGRSIESLKESASAASSNIGEIGRRIIDECKEGAERISQKFKA